MLTLRLEREVYTVTEGGSVEVCALLSSAASFTVSAGLLTVDLSATGTDTVVQTPPLP